MAGVAPPMTWLSKQHNTALEGCDSLRNGSRPLNVAVDRDRSDEHASADSTTHVRLRC